jgi:hypothetical protein
VIKILKSFVLCAVLLVAVQSTRVHAMNKKNAWLLGIGVTTCLSSVYLVPKISRWCNGKLLYAAASNNNSEMVKYFVENGADVNTIGNNGETPLYLAVFFNKLDLVTYLVEHGADVNTTDDFGKPPLHVAASNNKLDIVKYLVEHGADVNTKNNNKKTPLHYACFSDLEMVKFLVEHGADVRAKDKHNLTPLQSTTNVQIKAYLQLVEDFYAITVIATKTFAETFSDFTNKHLGNYELIKANMTDVVNLFPLASATFAKQLETFIKEKKLPDLLGQNEMRGLFLELAKKAREETNKMTYQKNLLEECSYTKKLVLPNKLPSLIPVKKNLQATDLKKKFADTKFAFKNS